MKALGKGTTIGLGGRFLVERVKSSQDKAIDWIVHMTFIVHFWQRENDKWKYLGRNGKSLLFEEKFNCNPSLGEADVYDHPLRGPVLTVGPSKEGSYYFKENELQGVLSHKHFNKGTPFHYLMLLE